MTKKIALLLTGILAFGLASSAGAQERKPELKRVRVLIVIDTNAPVIGKAVLADKASFLRILKEGIPADRYTVDILEDKNAHPDKIIAYYSKLKTGPDEALLFCYSGHGGTDERDHCFTIFGDGKAKTVWEKNRYYRFPRQSVVNAMRAKKPGLVLLLTACCSNYLPAKPDNLAGAAPPAAITAIKPVIRSLFFEHRGIVDITAAPPGEVALGYDTTGSLFGEELTKLLLGSPMGIGTGDFVTWQAFHKRLQEQMFASAMAHKRDEEALKKAGKLDKVSPAWGVQRAYGFQLADEGKVPRPKWSLGLNSDKHSGNGLIVLAAIADSPAGRAGFRKGDIVLNVNGRPVNSSYDLKRAIASSEGTLKIQFRRAGQVQTVEVKLDKLD